MYLFAVAWIGISWMTLCAQSEVPQYGEWHANSPDGKLLAAAREQPDNNLIWRMDLDRGVLEIVDLNEKSSWKYVRYDLVRLPFRIAWSPDSKYVVMTTVSAGGHSPWHFNAFVYSVGDRTLREMDETTGMVVSPTFEFVGPDIVEMGMNRPPDFDVDQPKKVKVDLEKSFRAMSTVPGRHEGGIDLSP